MSRLRRGSIEWIIAAVGALIIALLMRALVFQAFVIPSGSMENTLRIGDRVVVNKLAYKIHGIRRGDIVVFNIPTTTQANECTDWHRPDTKVLIKRVVALGGETVEMRDGTVYVDGNPLTEPYIKPGSGAGLPLPKTTVPEGSVWAMGDNREESADSRCGGAVPESDIVGHALFVMWPLDSISLL